MPLSQATASRAVLAEPAPRTIPDPPTRIEARRSPAVVLVSAWRVKQWLKNGLVVLAPLASGALVRNATAVAGAFVGFCLLSSATYLVNDVRDRDRDRRHPRKRHRPVASGELAPHGALRIAAAMAFVGVALTVAVRPALAAVAIAYLLLTTSYSLWWRNIVVADIVAIAAGFGLRAVAGGVAAGVPLTSAFLIITFASASFLIAGKRYAELRAAGANARATLARYSPAALMWVLLAAATSACAAYVGWELTRPGLSPASALSLAPFALWLGRYAMLLRTGAGEAPEDLVLRDPWLIAFAALWLVLFVLGGAHGPR